MYLPVSHDMQSLGQRSFCHQRANIVIEREADVKAITARHNLRRPVEQCSEVRIIEAGTKPNEDQRPALGTGSLHSLGMLTANDALVESIPSTTDCGSRK